MGKKKNKKVNGGGGGPCNVTTAASASSSAHTSSNSHSSAIRSGDAAHNNAASLVPDQMSHHHLVVNPLHPIDAPIGPFEIPAFDIDEDDFDEAALERAEAQAEAANTRNQLDMVARSSRHSTSYADGEGDYGDEEDEDLDHEELDEDDGGIMEEDEDEDVSHDDELVDEDGEDDEEDDEEDDGDDSKQGSFVEALIRLLEDSAQSHAQQAAAAAAATQHIAEGGDPNAAPAVPTGENGASNPDNAEAPPPSSAPFFSQSSLDAAFLLSCEGGHIRILYLLLPRISALNITNERGDTGLHLAARNGHGDIVELLLKHGSEVDAKSHDGITPLYAAVGANQLHAAALLLEHQRATHPQGQMPSVNIPDVEDESPLHLACRSGYTQLVLLLLRAGAECTSLNSEGEAPIDVAKTAEVARVLLEFQAQKQGHQQLMAQQQQQQHQHQQQFQHQPPLQQPVTAAQSQPSKSLPSAATAAAVVPSSRPVTADADDVSSEEDEEDFTIPPAEDEVEMPTADPAVATSTATSSTAATDNPSSDQPTSPIAEHTASASVAATNTTESAHTSDDASTVSTTSFAPSSLSTDPSMSSLDFVHDPLLDPLPPYSSLEPLLPCSPFRQLPSGPATTLFWTALGFGYDNAFFQSVGVYPFDRLKDTERVLVLGSTAEAMTGLSPPHHELQPNILNESALYAVFALMKRRIQAEINPNSPPHPADHHHPHHQMPPEPATTTSTLWRRRVLEAYEQVYSTSTAFSGLRPSCARLHVWSALIHLLARSLFGAAFSEKKKLFTAANGWERKLRQITATKEATNPALFPTGTVGYVRFSPEYFHTPLPVPTSAMETQLTFKKILLMSKTFLEPQPMISGNAALSKSACFCRECILEFEVPHICKRVYHECMQFDEKALRNPGTAHQGNSMFPTSSPSNASNTFSSSSTTGTASSKNKKKPNGKATSAQSSAAAEQREREKQHFQAHQQRLENAAAAASALAHQQHSPNKISTAQSSSTNQNAVATGVNSAAPAPPPYTLDSLILTSGPELQNYWCSLSMEDKWALTELPLSYLHSLISRHLNWELLRAALESYEEYAWEEDVLEIHEGATITVADEMCEESSMEDLLQAMIHAIHMRQLEERGEMDAQFEHALIRPDGSHQPLKLNLSASTQSARQMLENLVLSEFARKIAAAFLVSRRESRAAQIAEELERELLEEEKALEGGAGAKRKKKKAKAKLKKKLAMAAGVNGENDDDDDDSHSPSQAQAEQREKEIQAQREKEAAEKAAAIAKVEAERIAKEAEEKAAREAAEKEKERKKAEAREAKLKAKRERREARRAEAEANGEVEAVEAEDQKFDDAQPTTIDSPAKALLGPSIAAVISSSASAAALLESITASTTTPLNNKARRALIRAAKEAAAKEERAKENLRRAELGLPLLEEEEEQERLRVQAQEEEAKRLAEEEEAAKAAAKHEEEEKQAEVAPVEQPSAKKSNNSKPQKNATIVSTSITGSENEESKEERSIAESSDAVDLSVNMRSPPACFDDFDSGVMLICSRDQLKDTPSSSSTSATANPHASIALKILGLPRKHASILTQLTSSVNNHSTALFLFNVTDRLLHGVYYITTDAAVEKYNIKPKANQSANGGFVVVPSLTPAPGTLPFPPLLRVLRFEQSAADAPAPSTSATTTGSTPAAASTSGSSFSVDPIPEAAFRHLFADGNRIRTLELRQVKELMAIFRARARNHRAQAANMPATASSGAEDSEHEEPHAHPGSLRTLTGITPIPFPASSQMGHDGSEKRGSGSNSHLRQRGGATGGRGGARTGGLGPSRNGINVLTPIVTNSSPMRGASPVPEKKPLLQPMEPTPSAVIAHTPLSAPMSVQPTPEIIAATPHSHVMASEFATLSGSSGSSSLRAGGAPLSSTSALVQSVVTSSPFVLNSPMASTLALVDDDLAAVLSSDAAAAALATTDDSLTGSSVDVPDEDDFVVDSERMLQDLEKWDRNVDIKDLPLSTSTNSLFSFSSGLKQALIDDDASSSLFSSPPVGVRGMLSGSSSVGRSSVGSNLLGGRGGGLIFDEDVNVAVNNPNTGLDSNSLQRDMLFQPSNPAPMGIPHMQPHNTFASPQHGLSSHGMGQPHHLLGNNGGVPAFDNGPSSYLGSANNYGVSNSFSQPPPSQPHPSMQPHGLSHMQSQPQSQPPSQPQTGLMFLNETNNHSMGSMNSLGPSEFMGLNGPHVPHHPPHHSSNPGLDFFNSSNTSGPNGGLGLNRVEDNLWPMQGASSNMRNGMPPLHMQGFPPSQASSQQQSMDVRQAPPPPPSSQSGLMGGFHSGPSLSSMWPPSNPNNVSPSHPSQHLHHSAANSLNNMGMPQSLFGPPQHSSNNNSPPQSQPQSHYQSIHSADLQHSQQMAWQQQQQQHQQQQHHQMAMQQQQQQPVPMNGFGQRW